MITAESAFEATWSVEYLGLPYDSARLVRGEWYFRDPVSRNFVRFAFQDRVIPLYVNPA
jgi:hypothetical protein